MCKISKKTVGIGLSILVILLAIFSISYIVLSPSGDKTSKTISVDVVLNDATDTNYMLDTNEEYLGDTLRDNDIIPQKTPNEPTFVTTVTGITADSSIEQWWCLTKDGEFLTTGVDDTVISNGDSFELSLKEGY